ncbi:hypothetical protein [Actinocorallia longicatena]|uniref:Uncharacterized protein n=1 Tax=Actinocorallia longicatena TaxID=111803 RepID=A0ABP6QDX6_9ACTN
MIARTLAAYRAVFGHQITPQAPAAPPETRESTATIKTPTDDHRVARTITRPRVQLVTRRAAGSTTLTAVLPGPLGEVWTRGDR